MVSETMRQMGGKRSAIRETFEYGLRRAKIVGAENVFDFSLGNPSVPPPEAVNEAFLEALRAPDPERVHGYTIAPGAVEVREAVAASLNRRFGTSHTYRNLYLTCGAAAALTITFRALTIDDRSEFLALAPYFPEYACYARTAGAAFRVIPADEDGFQIDFALLEQSLGPHTQGVIINSPNNPSGVIYSAETLYTLAELLRKKSAAFGHPIYLISDEPYRELCYGGASAPSPAAFYEATIVTYSYSKSLSLPGDRIGYILVGDDMPDIDDVFDAVAGSARMQGYVCAPTLMQRVIARCADADVLPDLSSYQKNRDALYGALTKAGYRCASPDGAFYLFFEAPERDGDAFTARAREQDVLVVSGRDFGCPSFVRASYCVAYDVIARALPRFGALFETTPGS